MSEEEPKTYSFIEAIQAFEMGKKISRICKLYPGRKRILQKIVNDDRSFITCTDNAKKELAIYEFDQVTFSYEAILDDWVIEE